MRKIVVAILFFALIFTAAGCGAKYEQKKEWEKTGFHLPNRINENHEYWIEQFIPLNTNEKSSHGLYEVEYSITAPKSLNGKIYCLNAVITPPVFKASSWVLKIYDVNTKQQSEIEITYERLGLSNEDNPERMHYLVDFDCISETQYVFQWTTVSKKNEKYYQISDEYIYTDLNGSANRKDLLGKYKEHGMVEQGSEFSFIPQSSCVCDERGNSYHIIEKETGESLLVINEAGLVILEHQIPEGWFNIDSLRTDGGDVILLFDDEKEKNQRFIWIDAINEQAKEVACISDKEQLKKLCGMNDNIIYYETLQGKVYAWNIESGKRTLFLDYAENGLSSSYGRIYAFDNTGFPQMVLYKNQNNIDKSSEFWHALISDTKRNRTIQVYNCVGEGTGKNVLSLAISITSDNNPNNVFSYKEVISKDEKDKMLSEFVAGNGPDVLYVSRSDFVEYAEKGFLMDISDLIDNDIHDKVIPATLELGTVHNRIYGLPLRITAYCFSIPLEVYDENYWDINVFFDLIRKQELSRRIYYANSGTYLAPQASARLILKNSLGEPWLIDREEGACHFDGNFIQLLELLKSAENEAQRDESIADGNNLTYYDINSIDIAYEFAVNKNSNKYSFIGLPTNGEKGGYIDTEGILAVRTDVEKVDAVKDLFNAVCDERVQTQAYDSMYPSLKILKFDYENEVTNEFKQFFKENSNLQTSSNWESLMMTMSHFLENCVVAPIHEPDMESIIVEEIEPFFSCQKSAEEVAAILQSRIQIYLSERN